MIGSHDDLTTRERVVRDYLDDRPMFGSHADEAENLDRFLGRLEEEGEDLSELGQDEIMRRFREEGL